jgi:hypothetical protein
MGLFKKHVAEKSVNIGVFIICLWFHELEIGRYHLECFPHADGVHIRWKLPQHFVQKTWLPIFLNLSHAHVF